MNQISPTRLQRVCSLGAIYAALFIPSHTAWAFSEDICFSYVASGTKSGPIVPKPFNCWDLQCNDHPEDAKRPGACVVTGLATLVDAAVIEGVHVRNSLHFDVTYLLARLHGMRLGDARKLAVYDEATDLGKYQHFNQTGVRVVDSSVDIEGVRRTNFTTSGFWLHFVPWFRGAGTATESVLQYTADTGFSAPFPSTERPLNHLRAWAFGQQAELCEFGLTEGSAVTGNCLGSSQPATLYWDLPALSGPNNLVDVRMRQTVAPQWQRTKRVDGATDDCQDRNTCYDRSYSSKSASIEALGIYLHSLGDRLSHHHCSDGSAIASNWSGEGSPNNSADLYLFYPDICGTVAHTMLHYAETGHDLVPERTKDAIGIAAREIGQWVTLTGYPSRSVVLPKAGYPAVDEVDSLVTRIVQATAQAAAADRVAALCRLARDGYGIDWHDGNASCSYEAGSAGALSGTSQNQPTAARAGALSASDSGGANNLRLIARVVPSGEDTGQTGKVYFGARLPDNRWFFLSHGGFQSWFSGEPPAYYSGSLDVLTIPVLDGSQDLSTLRGTDFYLGYGLSLTDMLTKGKLSKVGSIPKLGTKP